MPCNGTGKQLQGQVLWRIRLTAAKDYHISRQSAGWSPRSFVLLICLPPDASWEVAGDDTSGWVPATHVGAPDGVPGS